MDRGEDTDAALMALVARQLGRAPSIGYELAAECPFGRPAVIKSLPFDPEGAPNPNIYYLTCPWLRRGLARLEDSGMISRLQERLHQDAALRQDTLAAQATYAKEFREAVREHADSSLKPLEQARIAAEDVRIAGAREPLALKCLHAHYAYYLVHPDYVLGSVIAGSLGGEWCSDDRCGATRYAVIDTGSNSTRLLVAETREARVRELIRRTRVTRLGEGVASNGFLRREARDRVTDCVDDYARDISRLGAGRTVVLATSSVRDASDGEGFIESLAVSHGYGYRILSGEEEASLSFRGATAGVDAGLTAMLFDVGGGSTEIAAGSGGKTATALSLELGCVRLTESFIRNDPPSGDELEALARHIDAVLNGEAGPVKNIGADVVMAVAGTAASLAAIDLGLASYERDAVDGHRLTARKVDGLFRMLAGMDREGRMRIPTMEEGRADVVVAGALIIERLMAFTDIDAVIVSESDILDGAVMAMDAGEL